MKMRWNLVHNRRNYFILFIGVASYGKKKYSQSCVNVELASISVHVSYKRQPRRCVNHVTFANVQKFIMQFRCP